MSAQPYEARGEGCPYHQSWDVQLYGIDHTESCALLLSHCKVSARSLQGRFKVIARTLPGHCQVIARSSQGHCQVVARSLLGHCQVVVRSLPDHCQVIARSLPCRWKVIARSLLGHCWVILRSLLDHCKTLLYVVQIQKFKNSKFQKSLKFQKFKIQKLWGRRVRMQTDT